MKLINFDILSHSQFEFLGSNTFRKVKNPLGPKFVKRCAHLKEMLLIYFALYFKTNQVTSTFKSRILLIKTIRFINNPNSRTPFSLIKHVTQDADPSSTNFFLKNVSLVCHRIRSTRFRMFLLSGHRLFFNNSRSDMPQRINEEEKDCRAIKM